MKILLPVMSNTMFVCVILTCSSRNVNSINWYEKEMVLIKPVFVKKQGFLLGSSVSMNPMRAGLNQQARLVLQNLWSRASGIHQKLYFKVAETVTLKIIKYINLNWVLLLKVSTASSQSNPHLHFNTHWPTKSFENFYFSWEYYSYRKLLQPGALMWPKLHLRAIPSKYYNRSGNKNALMMLSEWLFHRGAPWISLRGLVLITFVVHVLEGVYPPLGPAFVYSNLEPSFIQTCNWLCTVSKKGALITAI